MVTGVRRGAHVRVSTCKGEGAGKGARGGDRVNGGNTSGTADQLGGRPVGKPQTTTQLGQRSQPELRRGSGPGRTRLGPMVGPTPGRVRTGSRTQDYPTDGARPGSPSRKDCRDGFPLWSLSSPPRPVPQTTLSLIVRLRGRGGSL